MRAEIEVIGMAKKKTVTNAMRMLTAAKIKFETVEYE